MSKSFELGDKVTVESIDEFIAASTEPSMGNAFCIMGEFKRRATSDGFSQDEIDQVIKEAMTRDYDHLKNTIFTKYGIPDEIIEYLVEEII